MRSHLPAHCPAAETDLFLTDVRQNVSDDVFDFFSRFSISPKGGDSIYPKRINDAHSRWRGLRQCLHVVIVEN